MKNRKQLLILFAGIIVAALLIASNLRDEDKNINEVVPASQKKPHSPAGEQGLFDTFLKY